MFWSVHQICLHGFYQKVQCLDPDLGRYTAAWEYTDIENTNGECMRTRQITEELVSEPEKPQMSCRRHICTNHFHIFVSPFNLCLQRLVIMSVQTPASPSTPVASATASSSAAPSLWSARMGSSKPKEARPSPVSWKEEKSCGAGQSRNVKVNIDKNHWLDQNDMSPWLRDQHCVKRDECLLDSSHSETGRREASHFGMVSIKTQ